MILGFLDASLSPNTNIIYPWRPQKSEKTTSFLENIIFENIKKFGNQDLQNVWERRAPNKHGAPSLNFLNVLNTGSVYS